MNEHYSDEQVDNGELVENKLIARFRSEGIRYSRTGYEHQDWTNVYGPRTHAEVFAPDFAYRLPGSDHTYHCECKYMSDPMGCFQIERNSWLACQRVAQQPGHVVHLVGLWTERGILKWANINRATLVPAYRANESVIIEDRFWVLQTVRGSQKWFARVAAEWIDMESRPRIQTMSEFLNSGSGN